MEQSPCLNPARPKPLKRRHEHEDSALRAAIRSDLRARLAGYEIYTDPTVMPDRATGRLHVVLNCSVRYEAARRLEG